MRTRGYRRTNSPRKFRRETGEVAPRKQTRWRPRILHAQLTELAALIRERPDPPRPRYHKDATPCDKGIGYPQGFEQDVSKITYHGILSPLTGLSRHTRWCMNRN